MSLIPAAYPAYCYCEDVLSVKYPVIEGTGIPRGAGKMPLAPSVAANPRGRHLTDLAPVGRDHKRLAAVNQPPRVFGGPLCGCRLQLEFSVHHFIVDGMLEREAELLAEPLDVTVLGKNLGREPVELLVGAHDEEP